MEAYQASSGDTTPRKNILCPFSRRLQAGIPDRIVDNLSAKLKLRPRSFNAFSHMPTILYVHLVHSLCLNDICNDLRNHTGTLRQICGCTPQAPNGLSHASMTCSSHLAEGLFCKFCDSLANRLLEFISSGWKSPGFPYRFKKRTIYAIDSTTIQPGTDTLAHCKF